MITEILVFLTVVGRLTEVCIGYVLVTGERR